MVVEDLKTCLLNFIVGFITLTFAALPAAAQTSKAQTLQFDDTIYTVPDGWRAGKTLDEYTRVYSTDSPVPTIRIYRSADSPRSVLRWMKKKAIESFDDDDRDDAAKINNKSFKQGKQTFHVLGMKSGRELRVALAAIGNKKTNLFVLDVRIPRDKNDAKKVQQMVIKDFVNFCLAAKFISQGARPLLGKPKAGELEGAFFGLAYTYNLDLSTNFENQFFVFSKTGRFFKGLPKGDSVANLDFEKAIRLFPNKAGNYRVRNGKITLEFATGKTDTEDLKSKSTKSARALSPAKIPADGIELNGFYRDFHFSGFTPGSGISGGVTQQKTYTFTKSGSFKATQFSGTFGSFSAGGFSTGRTRPEVKGDYEVKDGTIILTSDDGKKAVCSIVQIGEKLLFINGDQYLKSDPKKRSQK